MNPKQPGHLVQQRFGIAMNSGSARRARSFAGDMLGADFPEHSGIHTREELLDAVVDPVLGAFTDTEVNVEQLFDVGELVGQDSWLSTTRQLRAAGPVPDDPGMARPRRLRQIA